MEKIPQTGRELTERIVGSLSNDCTRDKDVLKVIALIDAWVQKERDTAYAVAIQAAADKVDEVIPEEFRKGHESVDGLRSEIVTKYTRRAILALLKEKL